MHRITDQHLFDLAENRASVTPWDSTRMARELAASRKVIESTRAARHWNWDHQKPVATNVTEVVIIMDRLKQEYEWLQEEFKKKSDEDDENDKYESTTYADDNIRKLWIENSELRRRFNLKYDELTNKYNRLHRRNVSLSKDNKELSERLLALTKDQPKVVSWARYQLPGQEKHNDT